MKRYAQYTAWLLALLLPPLAAQAQERTGWDTIYQSVEEFTYRCIRFDGVIKDVENAQNRIAKEGKDICRTVYLQSSWRINTPCIAALFSTDRIRELEAKKKGMGVYLYLDREGNVLEVKFLFNELFTTLEELLRLERYIKANLKYPYYVDEELEGNKACRYARIIASIHFNKLLELVQ